MARSTLVARLTPPIPAGIATIGISGPDAVRLVSSHARLRSRGLEIGKIYYGWWPLEAESSFPADFTSGQEQIVACRTGEDSIEVHCHGGAAVCNAILQALERHGCQRIAPSDWPSQQISSISREAEQDLIAARSDKAAAVLLDQFNGALEGELTVILDLLSESCESDNAEAQRRLAASKVERLLQWCDFGCHLSSAWQVVFAGPPNVGKSSLINAIVGQARTIVHSEAGTTRDWIESQAVIAGWPVGLTDTAGIRASSDAIERQGIAKARERVQLADVLVLVVDSQIGWTAAHSELAQSTAAQKIVCWNKIDLASTHTASGQTPFNTYAASAIAEPGIEGLVTGIAEVLFAREPVAGQAVPFRQSHCDRLQAALSFLRSRQLAAAREQVQALLR